MKKIHDEINRWSVDNIIDHSVLNKQNRGK